MDLFITTQASLEPVLIEELAALGYQDVREGFRGVYLQVDSMRDVYRLNLHLRTASRVILPIKSFPVFDERSLYREASKIDWLSLLDPKGFFWIQAHASHPRLSHSLYAAQLVKDAIVDQFREKKGVRPSVSRERPDLILNVYVDGKKGIIGLDTSFDPLHMRGYRFEGGDSPVSESLAAACLLMGGYTGEQVLLDPMAGSGTFLIEAALIATKTPPGWFRKRFGFSKLPGYKEEDWLSVREEAAKSIIPLPKGKITGIEIDRNQFSACRTNLKTAGFDQTIQLIRGDFREVAFDVKPNFVVTNPPYGVRLGEDETIWSPLYKDLGDFLKRKTSHPAIGAVLTGSNLLSKGVGLKSKKRIPLMTGGLEARLLLFDLFSEPNQEEIEIEKES